MVVKEIGNARVRNISSRNPFSCQEGQTEHGFIRIPRVEITQSQTVAEGGLCVLCKS